MLRSRRVGCNWRRRCASRRSGGLRKAHRLWGRRYNKRHRLSGITRGGFRWRSGDRFIGLKADGALGLGLGRCWHRGNHRRRGCVFDSDTARAEYRVRLVIRKFTGHHKHYARNTAQEQQMQQPCHTQQQSTPGRYSSGPLSNGRQRHSLRAALGLHLRAPWAARAAPAIA